jgi:hypothetical protein
VEQRLNHSTPVNIRTGGYNYKNYQDLLLKKSTLFLIRVDKNNYNHLYKGHKEQKNIILAKNE